MTGPRIGSLCSGYGGLEMGVQAAIGGTTAWVDLTTVLTEHHFHADHCGGYEVAAWPCMPAKSVLDELLGGQA